MVWSTDAFLKPKDRYSFLINPEMHELWQVRQNFTFLLWEHFLLGPQKDWTTRDS